MKTRKPTYEQLLAEIRDLRLQLDQTNEMLNAIRNGEVDALVVSGAEGEQVYTLKGADFTYRLLVEQMTEGAMTVNSDSIILYGNRYLEMLFKTGLEKIIGSSLFDFVTDPDAGIMRSFLSAGAGGESRGELTITAADGTRIPVYATASTLRVEEEPLTLVVLTDLTSQKKFEAVAGEEQFSRYLLEQVAEAVIVIDRKGSIIRMSRAAASLCDKTPTPRFFDEAFGLMAAGSGPARGEAGAYVRRALGGETIRNIEMTFTREDDTVYRLIFSANPLWGSKTEITGCIISLADITGLRRAEEELQESEKLLRQIAENSQEVFWLLTADASKLLYVSPAYEAVWQSPVQTAFDTPRSWLGMVHPDDAPHLKELLKNNFRTGLDTEFRIVRKDGSERWIWARTFPIADESGAPYRILAAARDITDRKHLEEELIKAQKLESVGILAGGIAHDFNNLLTAIIGNITLAKVKMNSKEKALMLMDKAEEATMKAAELTQRLITFATGGLPLTRIAYINELLIDATHFALSGSNVTSTFSLPHDLWPVKIDEGQIRQVIQNIVINSREAMPGGGKIEMSARNVDFGEDAPAQLEPGRYVSVSIRDNGPGIGEKDLPRIFDPYFSTKQRGPQKGMGLGLSVCHSIIARHNGRITVESREGAGATVEFFLPASDEKPAERRPPNILIMDDELVVLDMAAGILAEAGMKVASARTGEEAVKLYGEAKANGAPFDAVILDLTIPGAMGGLATLRKLMSIEPGVKAIVSSGYLNDVVLTNYREHGFMAAVPKPYKPEDLLRTVTHVTGRGSVYH